MTHQEKRENDTEVSKSLIRRVFNRARRVSDVSWILFSTGLLVGFLLGISWKLDEISERAKFLAGNILSILALLVIVLQSLIYRRQREVMEYQWQSMQDGLERTDRAIEKMGRQQRTMHTQSIAALSEARSTREGLIETRKLVAQNEQALKAAQDNVDTAEKIAIYSQRAYLSATAEVRVGSGYMLHLIIRNSGNTPANKVEVWYSFDFLEQEPSGLDADFSNHVPAGVIAPRTEHALNIAYTKEISPERYRKEFQPHRHLGFYCWGTVHYEDIFNQRRLTKFCFNLRSEYGTGVPCKTGNEAY
jgi:hypothetical protein